MSKYVSPELYHKYQHQVLEMSLAIQYYEGTTARRESSSLSDREIAERLGLDVEDVTEIRCIAEIDLLPADTWIKSDNWKREKARKSFGKRQPRSRDCLATHPPACQSLVRPACAKASAKASGQA